VKRHNQRMFANSKTIEVLMVITILWCKMVSPHVGS